MHRSLLGLRAAARPGRSISMGPRAVHSELVDVRGKTTEILRLTAAGGEKECVHVVIIPGNPGAAGYYAALMEALHRRCLQAGVYARMTACSSAGFHTIDHPHDMSLPPYDLQQQCAHKAAFLQDHCIDAHSMPIVVVGHSIGAYMGIKAARILEGDAANGHLGEDASLEGAVFAAASGRQRAASGSGEVAAPDAGREPRIRRVVALAPFFETSPNWTQTYVRFLSRFPGALAAAASVLQRAPPAWLSPLYSRGMNRDALRTTQRLIRWDAVRTAFTLARSEFVTLDDGALWPELSAFEGRLSVLVGPEDRWFPESHFQRLKKLDLLQDHDLVLLPGLSHGFCTSDAECDTVAAVVKDWILRSIESQVLVRS